MASLLQAGICLDQGRSEYVEQQGAGMPEAMNKKKPDALVILAVIFGLGVLVSSLTYGGNESRHDQMAVSAGVKSVTVTR
ncbi:hypothetical protein [Isoalcanivorax indicus]|uniref:hypothetical protein n=1 Tax=Isoalcanivorax indicus TaxID=2202653 RepID=UPI0013C45BBB|nr:hypothetical protein [Isoalcanivorax indicus]